MDEYHLSVYEIMTVGRHHKYQPHCTVESLLQKYLPIHAYLSRYSYAIASVYYQGRHRVGS